MRKYLKFVGVVELVCTVIGTIILFIDLVKVDSALKTIAIAAGVSTTAVSLSIWILFIVYLIFAPAVGLLFIAVSNLIKDKEKLEYYCSDLTRATNAVIKKINGEENPNSNYSSVSPSNTGYHSIVSPRGKCKCNDCGLEFNGSSSFCPKCDSTNIRKL